MSRPPRIKGFNFRGHYRYLITFCTHLRREILSDDIVAREILTQFRITASEEHFAIAAYCLMPDHVHLLVEGLTLQSDLRRFVRIGKQLSGYSYSKATGGHRLWQEGFHDRSLRRDDDLRKAAKYIIENPVRAGLAASPQDYKYCGSDVWPIADILSG